MQGGVRAQFSTPSIDVVTAIPFCASFAERLGHPAGYCPQGYLFCADERRAHGPGAAETWWIRSAETILASFYLRANYEKQWRGDDIVGGSFCASE
jgi:hypothetical protein